MLCDGEPARLFDEDPWAYYRSIQLTPEEKAEARAEFEKDVERAKAAGVYERIAAYREQQVRKRIARRATPAKKRSAK